MARRPFTTDRTIMPGVRRRIRIPKIADRPTKITRDVFRRDLIDIDPWYWTQHRRLQRSWVGMEYQESRAVPKSRVRGFLPERIEYLYLVRNMHFTDGGDFTFQSSLEGGRSELGGMVADFLFFIMRVIIQVQGPTHDRFINQAKDKEQREILEDMGYAVWYLPEKTVYSPYALEAWHREHFAYMRGTGRGYVASHDIGEETGLEDDVLTTLLAETEDTLRAVRTM